MNGVIFSELLKNLHRSDDWLRQHLQQAGLSELQEIFLVEWWNDRLTIVMCDGTIRTQTAI